MHSLEVPQIEFKRQGVGVIDLARGDVKQSHPIGSVEQPFGGGETDA